MVFGEIAKWSLQPTVVSFNTSMIDIVNQGNQKGDVKTGSKLLKEMQNDGHVPGAVIYNVFMNGFCK